MCIKKPPMMDMAMKVMHMIGSLVGEEGGNPMEKVG